MAWGNNGFGQTNVPTPNTGFVAVAAGYVHSLGLKADGSIVAWGCGTATLGEFPNYGQCNVPAPNTGFVAVAAGWNHSISLKADGSIVAWGDNRLGQCDIPSPNSDFVAIAAGSSHSLGLKGLRGDRDADGDVDLEDFGSLFGHCLEVGGPGVPFAAGCHDAYLGMDRFLDLQDVAAFQTGFTEP